MENKNAYLIISNIFTACCLILDNTDNLWGWWFSVFLSVAWLALYIIESIKEDRKP